MINQKMLCAQADKSRQWLYRMHKPLFCFSKEPVYYRQPSFRLWFWLKAKIPLTHSRMAERIYLYYYYDRSMKFRWYRIDTNSILDFIGTNSNLSLYLSRYPLHYNSFTHSGMIKRCIRCTLRLAKQIHVACCHLIAFCPQAFTRIFYFHFTSTRYCCSLRHFYSQKTLLNRADCPCYAVIIVILPVIVYADMAWWWNTQTTRSSSTHNMRIVYIVTAPLSMLPIYRYLGKDVCCL